MLNSVGNYVIILYIFMQFLFPKYDCFFFIKILAEIPGVARDSIRNEGTRKIMAVVS
jgi:hypothetical protein